MLSISRDGIFRLSNTSQPSAPYLEQFDATNSYHVYRKLTDLSLRLSSQEKIAMASTLINKEGGFDINQPLNPGVPCTQEYRLLDSAFDCLFEWEKSDVELATFLVRHGANPSLCKPYLQSGNLFDSMQTLFSSLPLLKSVEKQLTGLSKNDLIQLSAKSKLYENYLTSSMWNDNEDELIAYHRALFTPPEDIDLAIYQRVISSIT